MNERDYFCLTDIQLNGYRWYGEKERWVRVMENTGFSEEDMQNWHKQFEKMESNVHQESLELWSFGALELLNIDQQEVESIRE